MDNEVLCVGDATIDAFLTIHEASVHCRLNERDCELCIRYGEKIPVETCCFLLGGIACNVSVGLSRLGLGCALIAEIGDDEFSAKIIKGLKAERVDTAHVVQTQGANSSFAIGINFKGERTLFVEHVQRRHDFHFDRVGAPWVYLGGLGKEWKEAYARTIDFIRKNKAKLAFTPGSQQFAQGVARFIDVVNASSVLFVNLDEAIKMSNVPPKADKIANVRGNLKSIKHVLETLQEMGPKIVSITDGRNGSFVIDEEGKTYQMPMFPGDAIEKTGAGDAYTSGMLGALILDMAVPEAMRFGAVNAASVVTKIGAQEGLLDREEIEKRLVEHSDFQAKVL